eukprot:TRINITY_DN33295_c0_g3_i1.p1 TRINITY_DN33295_c0_g3~~TRINITY_DN33295_c0_g3_i1.p1  ORF type:complete len:200 (+),score=17.95 TRINITY_DN33295_c0_g3_i1:13-612(+)
MLQKSSSNSKVSFERPNISKLSGQLGRSSVHAKELCSTLLDHLDKVLVSFLVLFVVFALLVLLVFLLLLVLLVLLVVLVLLVLLVLLFLLVLFVLGLVSPLALLLLCDFLLTFLTHLVITLLCLGLLLLLLICFPCRVCDVLIHSCKHRALISLLVLFKIASMAAQLKGVASLLQSVCSGIGPDELKMLLSGPFLMFWK